jgi:outer membrane usher protein FimD/PapC
VGGFSYQKTYLLDPYFIKNPTMNLTGAVMLPTKADIYQNGLLVRQEELAPGEFELLNVMMQTGVGFVEIVLTDPFGNIERFHTPSYLSTRLLKAGYHEYQYNLGFLREKFDVKSFEYGDPVISGSHRYGVDDALTIELFGEAASERYRLGSSATYLLPRGGVIAASLIGSRIPEEPVGGSGTVRHEYQSRTFSTHVEMSYCTKRFAAVLPDAMIDGRTFQLAAGIGFNAQRLGSISSSVLLQTFYDAATVKVAAVGYSRNIAKRTTFLSQFRWTSGADTSYAVVASLQYTPGQDIAISARHQYADGANTSTVQIQKNTPIGEGVGGQVLYEQEESRNLMDTFLQYNARYGSYAGRYRLEDGAHSYQLSASGAVVYVADTVRFTRPVQDSFALVQVGNVEGVTVYYNSRDVGKTDSDGTLVIPELNSLFDNQISINDRDIPLDYTLAKIRTYVSPPLHSGTRIPFEADRFQAAGGSLHLKTHAETRPVSLVEVQLQADDRTIVFQTDREGNFYIEQLKPGTYAAAFDVMGKTCKFDVIIPASTDVIIDLGALTCALDS